MVVITFAMAIAVVSAAGLASAQVTGSLVTVTTGANAGSYDDLERLAATANQSVYNVLEVDCTPGVNANCPQAQFNLFTEARQLVETANDILGVGPTGQSLQLDNEGLGNALRWTAAEEVSAKSRALTDFSNGQQANVNNRITALRFGATGFSIAGFEGIPSRQALGLDAEAALEPAGVSETLSKMGGFINGAYGFGKNDPTTFEDAFDYTSIDVTAGVDYRLRPDLVLGLVTAYNANKVDFNPRKSIVDGNIEAEGFSIGAFGLYSWKDVYFSGFASYQWMNFDVDRFITYPSLNPNVPGTNTRTTGNSDSNAVTVSATTGYTYRFGPGKSKMFLLDPYARADYTHIVIGKYDEKNTSPNEEFALRINEQKIDSMELSAGLRASVAISTPIGVFFPYVRGEWRFELITDSVNATSRYLALGDKAKDAVSFLLEGEGVDSNYGTITGGLQTILLGGRQRELGGPVGDRLSIFAEYRRVIALEKITSQLVNGGVRYQF
jgi:hypothetical protein